LPVEQPIVFSQAARAEVVDAQDWYETQAEGLGRRFRNQVDVAVQRIGDNPLQFPIVSRDVRRALVRGFPYCLFFHLDRDAVTVVACFHASRDPRQWQGRRPRCQSDGSPQARFRSWQVGQNRPVQRSFWVSSSGSEETCWS